MADSMPARINGGSAWTIFWHIILPLSKPALATVAFFHFLYARNDLVGPLLYLTRKQSITLALALPSDQPQPGGIQWHDLMAASAVTTLPIIVLFFLTQKTIIQGIATTGSKGRSRSRPGDLQRDCCLELGVVIALLCRKNHASTCSYPPTD